MELRRRQIQNNHNDGEKLDKVRLQ